MFSAFVDILFPRVCHICSKSLKEDKTAFDKNICLRCAQEMARTSVVSCSLCAQKLDTEKELRTLLCRSCAKEPRGYEKLLACFIYQGPTKELIHKFKYGNRPYLAKTIARLMLTTLEHDGQSLHKKRMPSCLCLFIRPAQGSASSTNRACWPKNFHPYSAPLFQRH